MNNDNHWINPYPTENAISFLYTYPLDSVLSSGYCYPTFEQLRPELSRSINLTLVYHDYTNKYMNHILFFTFNVHVRKLRNSWIFSAKMLSILPVARSSRKVAAQRWSKLLCRCRIIVSEAWNTTSVDISIKIKNFPCVVFDLLPWNSRDSYYQSLISNVIASLAGLLFSLIRPTRTLRKRVNIYRNLNYDYVLIIKASVHATVAWNGCSHSSFKSFCLDFSLRLLSKSSRRVPLFRLFPWSSNTSVAWTSSGIHS